jgi:hypothetical protein
VAQITGAQILGRLGDPNRFDSQAGAAHRRPRLYRP